MSKLAGFVAKRRSLRDEYQRILAVQMQAVYLVEELRRRRDGEAHRYLDLPQLARALDEVAASPVRVEEPE
jgi:hypothetical protein